MPQFSGHWYSGRAARLVFVEAALVGVALSISGHDARGWRELAALVGAAGCVPAALYLADLYDPQVMRNDRTRGANVLKALGFAALAAAIFGLLGGGALPRGALIDTIGVASVGVLLARAALVARLDERGHNRVLVIGAGQRAAEIERIVRSEAYGEYEIAGKLDPTVDLSQPQQIAAGGGEVIAAAGSLVERGEVRGGEVALGATAEVLPASQLIVGPGGAPSQIKGPMAEAKVAERVLRRIPMALVRPSDLAIGEGLNSPVRTAAKRVFDLVMSSILVVCTAPLLAVLSILIKLDSKGPVFYFQERVGRGGRIYRLHKLRTMRKDAETHSGPVRASRRDPRVTRMGAFLRKTRLDELPQVFAVFRGDMSFVGPRPERPFFVQQLK